MKTKTHAEIIEFVNDFKAQHPKAWEWMQTARANRFADSLFFQLTEKGELTQKQIAAANRAAEKHEENWEKEWAILNGQR